MLEVLVVAIIRVLPATLLLSLTLRARSGASSTPPAVYDDEERLTTQNW